MQIEHGNVNTLDLETGWIVGYSSSAAASPLRHLPALQAVRTLCVKWMNHPAGDPRGTQKPPSEGRTISILVSVGGHFRIEFAADAAFFDAAVQRHSLSRTGDYVMWGENIHHRWFVDAACTIL